MPARKKAIAKSTSGSFFTKDLFIFIIIMAVVAMVTYVLTYNAIMAKFNQEIDATGAYPSMIGK